MGLCHSPVESQAWESFERVFCGRFALLWPAKLALCSGCKRAAMKTVFIYGDGQGTEAFFKLTFCCCCLVGSGRLSWFSWIPSSFGSAAFDLLASLLISGSLSVHWDPFSRSLPPKIFTLWFPTIAKLQSGSSHENNFMVRVHYNMKNWIKGSQH